MHSGLATIVTRVGAVHSSDQSGWVHGSDQSGWVHGSNQSVGGYMHAALTREWVGTCMQL